MIYELLEGLGFSRKEIDIYIAILQSGKISASDVAAMTDINRTTVYSVVKELIRKRVIREDITAKKTYLLARPPEDLYLLVERDKQQLRKREHAINKAITELNSLSKSSRYSVPRIVFIDEDEIEKYLYGETEKWDRSIMERGDGVWRGFQDHTFVESYEEWITWSWKQPYAKKLSLKLLTNESTAEERMQRKKIGHREMKFWKHENPFSASMWVCGEYLVMIVTKTRPHYLVEIHDAILCKNMTGVFTELWQKM